ncbi:unnamed protein product [Acanthoscelides obtectus]|uniref:Uncharacterized protein n=1 Tax=Acanthoscelides obtectus TaxID=200917 RepID=A0A9P0KB87_ACAOB|nr:unnamed protein product [Acanthoscelides obtectus]CAK1656419.1 hypothetical protein AOBTE_LOCUS19702 [Acanthoscelides obtectus]
MTSHPSSPIPVLRENLSIGSR